MSILSDTRSIQEMKIGTKTLKIKILKVRKFSRSTDMSPDQYANGGAEENRASDGAQLIECKKLRQELKI